MISAEVDLDFKDRDAYEVYTTPSTGEPWHVCISLQEDGKYTHWALLQMLVASSPENVDFAWAAFMKTGRVGSSALRHFSKKFTDPTAAFQTFSEWFEEKSGNAWHPRYAISLDGFERIPGKYWVLSREQGQTMLESRGEKENVRPKLGKSNVPVDIYFKDRDQYQVYVTPDGDVWTAVLSIEEGGRHSQYSILQVLVAKPNVKVEFDFVVFLRRGKLGGSAQRYAKRYTVEAAALATFCQWYKEKTGNEWYGSFRDSLDEFEPQIGKFNLLAEEDWHEVVEFEEHAKPTLITSDVEVDMYYRDRHLYRVYHTDKDELWAVVLGRKTSDGQYKRFVVLQMLVAAPGANVDFEFVVLRRIGEKGEAGQWTAKKFTNELDALRTFKMWYNDETGNTWKGSYTACLKDFVPDAEKLTLLPREDWEEATRETPFMLGSPDCGRSTVGRLSSSFNNGTYWVSSTVSTTTPPLPQDESLSPGGEGKSSSAPSATPPPRPTAQTPLSPERSTGPAAKEHPVDESDPVDEYFENRNLYTTYHSAKMVQTGNDGNVKRFYVMQILQARPDHKVPERENFVFFVRTGRLGSIGMSNFKYIRSKEVACKAFEKKFADKTGNEWRGSHSSTISNFTSQSDLFSLVSTFPEA